MVPTGHSMGPAETKDLMLNPRSDPGPQPCSIISNGKGESSTTRSPARWVTNSIIVAIAGAE